MKIWHSFFFLSFFFLKELQAQNPLSLAPGAGATKVFGSIISPANFDLSTGAADISYNNADLATRSYYIRLPSGFDASDITKKYGIITYTDAGDTPTVASSWLQTLDDNNLIYIAGQGIGNSQFTDVRAGVTIMGAFRLIDLGYKIDTARIYATGTSGGSQIASILSYLRNDFYHGFICRVGANLPTRIPGWQTYGRTPTASVPTYYDDADYEWNSYSSGLPSIVLPKHLRLAIGTQSGDFRRSELAAVYRYGHLNHGNTVRFLTSPGGHSDENGPQFKDSMDYMNNPLIDIIWDRFENGNLGINTQPGKVVAGNGFTTLSGTVVENSYTFTPSGTGGASSTQGVLRLTGDGAAVEAKDTFTWQNVNGITLDARLRAELATTANQNQQIGLHIIPASSAGNSASLPGFHLYWCYGQPYRAELVAANGTRKTLATWQYTATHPMALPTTVTSTQSGEGVVQEKTFWGDNAAPDFSGRTLAFRGEDLRLALNSKGFQLTFNRPATNVTTSYPGVVSASFDDTFPTPSLPQAPNENFPIVLQGFWADVETALVSALPAGNWKLRITNNAITTGQATGNAVVDEIHLVGSTGAPAAPATVTATAASGKINLAWTEIVGVASYLIKRADSPDGPFTTLATVPGYVPTYSDTAATENRAYYYTVSAVSLIDTTSAASPVAFASPNFSVLNFGFETPNQGTGSSAYTYGTAGASWTFGTVATGGSGLTANSTALTSSNNAAPEGKQVAFIQGLGTFSQTLTGLSVGSTYSLTYAAAIRQNGTGAILQNWNIKLDSTTLSTVTPSGTLASNKPYVDRAFTFVPTSASQTLFFNGTVSNNKASVFIDNIRIARALPLAPTSLVVTYPAEFQIRLAWTDNATDETAYRIERSPAGLNLWTVFTNSLAANTTSYTDTSVAGGAPYDYRVIAISTVGFSGFATISATTPSAAPPVPSGLGATTSYTTATLSWASSTQADSYNVKRGLSASGPFTTVGTGLSAASYTDAGLTPATNYFYAVSAVGGSLESANSTAIAATTVAIPAPSNLVVAPGFTTNALSWTAAPGITNHTIRRALSSGGPFTVLVSSFGGTSYTDTALTTSTTYYYTVASVSESFESDVTPAVSSTPISGTAIKSNNAITLDQGASWSTGIVPSSLDNALWTGTYTTPIAGIGSGLSTKQIQVANPSQGCTIGSGTGSMILGSGGIDMSVSSQDFTIAAPVVLQTSQTWNVNSGRTLTVGGNIGESTAATGLTFASGGTILLTGGTTFTGPVSIASNTKLIYNTLSNTSLLGGVFSQGTLRNTSTTGSVTLWQPAANVTLTSLQTDVGATFVLQGNPAYTTTISDYGVSTGGLLQFNSGNWSLNGSAGNIPNFEVNGGTLHSFQGDWWFNTSGVKLNVHGGQILSNNTYGFRLGSTFGAGADGGNFTGSQDGGSISVTASNLDLGNSTANSVCTYTLTGGTLSTDRKFFIGSALTGTGSTTFTLSGTGKLRVADTIIGAQGVGARQNFVFTGGTLAAGTVNMTQLTATGTVTSSPGTLTNNGGILAPGEVGTAGRTSLIGNYTANSTATLALDLGGTSQATGFQSGQYDFLTVTGTTTLAGNLSVALLPGFAPANATTFVILSSTGTLSGAFSNVAFNQRIVTTGGEGTFLVTQSGNTVTLSAYTSNTPLQIWRYQNLGTIANSGTAADTADPDGDGLTNLIEFAYGLNPLVPSSGVTFISPSGQFNRGMATFSPVVTADGVNYFVLFCRRKDYVTAGLTYTVQFSADLSNWQNNTVNATVVAFDNEMNAVTVPYPSLLNNGAKPQFFRLNISSQ